MWKTISYFVRSVGKWWWFVTIDFLIGSVISVYQFQWPSAVIAEWLKSLIFIGGFVFACFIVVHKARLEMEAQKERADRLEAEVGVLKTAAIVVKHDHREELRTLADRLRNAAFQANPIYEDGFKSFRADSTRICIDAETCLRKGFLLDDAMAFRSAPPDLGYAAACAAAKTGRDQEYSERLHYLERTQSRCSEHHWSASWADR